MKPCAAAEGRAAGPIDWRALAFLPFAPCTGEGPGLGLEGGLRDIVGVVCVKKEKKPNRIKKRKNKNTRSCFFLIPFFFIRGRKTRRRVGRIVFVQ